MAKLSSIRVHEVAPRDGLQDESRFVPTETKLKFIAALASAGCRSIEITAFVNRKKIPQMADAEELIRNLKPVEGVEYTVLVPNMRGLENALKCGIKTSGTRNIAVFTAATEDFSVRNIGMSVEQSLREFTEVIRTANAEGLSVRGYISTCFYDPFRHEKVGTKKVRKVADKLFEIGCREVCLADTTGDAAPKDVYRLLHRIDPKMTALHFHDKNGEAIRNVRESIELGFNSFDSSAGGLGGCPMAPERAPGNIATENLIKFALDNGIITGIDPVKLTNAIRCIAPHVSKRLTTTCSTLA